MQTNIKYEGRTNRNKTHKTKIKRSHIRIYIMRAIQFRHGHKPNNQKANRHTDGKGLSVAPNTTGTISRNIFNSFICGWLRNCNQNIHNEGHTNRHPNRDIYSKSRDKKKGVEDAEYVMEQQKPLPSTATRLSGGNTSK